MMVCTFCAAAFFSIAPCFIFDGDTVHEHPNINNTTSYMILNILVLFIRIIITPTQWTMDGEK